MALSLSSRPPALQQIAKVAVTVLQSHLQYLRWRSSVGWHATPQVFKRLIQYLKRPQTRSQMLIDTLWLCISHLGSAYELGVEPDEKLDSFERAVKAQLEDLLESAQRYRKREEFGPAGLLKMATEIYNGNRMVLRSSIERRVIYPDSHFLETNSTPAMLKIQEQLRKLDDFVERGETPTVLALKNAFTVCLFWAQKLAKTPEGDNELGKIIVHNFELLKSAALELRTGP